MPLTPTQARQSDLISLVRRAVTEILDARADLKAVREKLAVATSSTAGAIDPAAFAGLNADLDVVAITMALSAFDSIEALFTKDNAPTPTLVALLRLSTIQ